MTGKDAEPVPIRTRLREGQGFDSLFREGMALVEETAAYLDGPGRADAKGLPRLASLVYATESLRLTRRLMQIAAWLLLQRAVSEGELDPAQARKDRRRIRLEPPEPVRAGPGFDELPDGIKSLIERSVRLHGRVSGLDADPDPVGRHIARIEAAFRDRPEAEPPTSPPEGKSPGPS